MKSIQLAGRVYTCRPLIIYNDKTSNTNNIIQQKDGQVLCAKGNSIIVISIETGEQIGIFQDHKASVSCLRLINNNSSSNSNNNNSNSNRILSCSLDGMVIAWNLDNFQQYNQFSLNVPIFEVIIPFHANDGNFLNNNIINDENKDGKRIYSRDELYFVVGKSSFLKYKNDNDNKNDIGKKEKNMFKLIAYDTAAHKIRRKVTNLKYGINNVVSIFIKNEEFIVAASRTKLLLWSIDSKELVGPKFNSEIGSITSVTANSDKGIIVTGHNQGEIVIWHDLPFFISQSSKISPTCTILHWHAHPVASLCLSSDGLNLYSGGEEGVLVVWQISGGTKSFVPRLGASITHLNTSSTDAKVAIVSMDNSIRLINIASLKEEWIMRSLYTLPPQKQIDDEDEKYEPDLIALARTPSLYSFTPADSKFKVCKIAIEKRSGNIICNGYPGQLQSYDLLTQTMSTSHEIIQFSHISKKESFTKMYVPCTTHFDFIKVDTEDFMATVDVRRGEDTLTEISLKFWIWDIEKKKYTLTAQVDSPHGSSKISAIALSIPYHSKRLQNTVFSLSCCTSADDGTVKVWKATKVPILNSNKFAIQWSCAFAYKYRDSPVKYISFSPDGSLLAVCQENFITLWDPSRVTLKTSILGSTSSNIIFAEFLEPKRSNQLGGGAGKSMLVIGTKKSLSVYDIIEMKLMWIINGRFSAFAVASSERETIQVPNTNNSNDNNGWIAVASLRHDSVNNIKVHELLLFSPYNSSPIYCETNTSKIVSLSFWNNINDLYSPCGGIICVAYNGDINFISLSSSIDSTLKMKVLTAAHISKKALPSMEIESGELLQKGDIHEKINKQAIPKAGWLSRIFDGSTENIPPISVLYDGYMSNLLQSKQSSNAVETPYDQSFSYNSIIGKDIINKNDSDNENDRKSSTSKNQQNEIDQTRSRRKSITAEDDFFADDVMEALHNSVQSIFNPNTSNIITNLGRRSRSNSTLSDKNENAIQTPASKKVATPSKSLVDASSVKSRSNSVGSQSDVIIVDTNKSNGSRSRTNSIDIQKNKTPISTTISRSRENSIIDKTGTRSRSDSIDNSKTQTNDKKTPISTTTTSRSRENSIDKTGTRSRSTSIDNSKTQANDKTEEKGKRSTRSQLTNSLTEKVIEKVVEKEPTSNIGRGTRSNSQSDQKDDIITTTTTRNRNRSTSIASQASNQDSGISIDKNVKAATPAKASKTKTTENNNDQLGPLREKRKASLEEKEKIEDATPRRSTRSKIQTPILNIKDVNNKMKL